MGFGHENCNTVFVKIHGKSVYINYKMTSQFEARACTLLISPDKKYNKITLFFSSNYQVSALIYFLLFSFANIYGGFKLSNSVYQQLEYKFKDEPSMV